MTRLLVLAVLLATTGCMSVRNYNTHVPPATVNNALQREFDSLPGPVGEPITVAVYSFTDKTGQRKSTGGNATTATSFSSAVTQGAEVYLIQALQTVGRGQWFRVLERVGIDDVSRERQLIRQMRETYEGANAKALDPMLYAGVLIEGGIIGYDSATRTGGIGVKLFGIGPSVQYSVDTIYVSLRLVSVQTGEVLVSINTQKTVYSYGAQVASLKFINGGTDALEAEIGVAGNEPVTFAVKTAIEGAVLDLVKEGSRANLWKFKTPPPQTTNGVSITSPTSNQKIPIVWY
jgi:curli production assembly/transport component CsgG